MTRNDIPELDEGIKWGYTALSIPLCARLCLFSSAHSEDLLVQLQFSRSHSHKEMDNGVRTPEVRCVLTPSLSKCDI